jgi:hypothetical protein
MKPLVVGDSMEVISNIGLGFLRFGMSPEQVRSLFEEPEIYEE